MMKLIDFKDHQQCPYINGISYADEQIQLMELVVNKTKPVTFDIIVGIKTSVAELEASGKMLWGDCIIEDEFSSEEEKITVLCGEGNLGSDGFVALMNDQGKLKWIAFFDCSNPFIQLKFIDKVVFAETSLGHIWKFPINTPHLLTIENPRIH